MTIVASNSLTLSNVNDGTITHTAYSWSADGTDGFTTVYPNLNLLNNTKITQNNLNAQNQSAGVSSSLSVGSNNGIKVINNGGNIGSQGGFAYAPTINVKAGGAITVSCYIKNTGTVDINNFSLGFAFYGTTNSYPTKGKLVVPTDGKYYFFSFTTIVPNGVTTARPRWFDVATVVNETHIFEVYGMKLEPGSIATPYMLSESEVKTSDYPSYIGQYSDFTATASTDPTKYAPWTVFKGIDGNNGRGIVSSEQKYQVTTTPAKPVDPWENSVWKTTQPTTTSTNKYLWSITRTTFNLAPLTQDIVEQKAVYGDKGTDGDPGKIVSDTEPTTRFKGLTWKYSGTADLKASDGTVIKPNTEYYYNGTHWMINFLSANNIDANSITAEKINGTDLEVKNGKFTDGVIETSWKNGTVAGSTNIENDHLIITRTDSSVNTTNSIGLDSTQGLIMVYTENSTGRTISVGTNFQGMSLTDSTGISASISPAGVKLSSDVNWTQIGNIGGRRAEWKRENNRVTMNIHGGNGDGFPVITSGGTLLGILPTNARPPSDISMPATAQGAGATAQISINSTGEVRCYRWGRDSVYFGAYISYYVE